MSLMLVSELSSFLDKTLETSRKEMVKSNVERAGRKCLPQIKLPDRRQANQHLLSQPKCSAFEQSNSSNDDCECQICRVVRVQIAKRNSPNNNCVSSFLSILANEKKQVEKTSATDHDNRSVVTEYWSTPFSSNEFRNGARKYGSSSAAAANSSASQSSRVENDFIKWRRKALIRDEINSLKKTSAVAAVAARKKNQRGSDECCKYFFRDLNDLRTKLVAQQEEEYSFMLHDCPAPKFKSAREKFDVASKYKQNVRLSKDISEFIDRQRGILRNRPSLAASRGSVSSDLGRIRTGSLGYEARKNSERAIVTYEPPILDDNDPNNYSLQKYLNDGTTNEN